MSHFPFLLDYLNFVQNSGNELPLKETCQNRHSSQVQLQFSPILLHPMHHFFFRYKYLIQDILDSHSPGIPIEIPFKSCSTRLHQLLIALLLPVEFRDYLRVRLAPRLKRQGIAVLAISHRIRYSSRIGGDHGHAEGVGLPDDIRDKVSSCRQNEEVSHSVELLNLACLSLIVFIQERD